VWLAQRAAPARKAKRDGAPCVVKASVADFLLGTVFEAGSRSRIRDLDGLSAWAPICREAARHGPGQPPPQLPGWAGVRRAVALLSIIGLLAWLAAVMFCLGALLVARSGAPGHPTSRRVRDPLRRLPPAVSSS
jgi:hypothetical protein